MTSSVIHIPVSLMPELESLLMISLSSSLPGRSFIHTHTQRELSVLKFLAFPLPPSLGMTMNLVTAAEL